MPGDDRPAPHAEEVSDKGALPIGEGRFFYALSPSGQSFSPEGGASRRRAGFIVRLGDDGLPFLQDVFLLLQFTVFRELIDDHGDDDQ